MITSLGKVTPELIKERQRLGHYTWACKYLKAFDPRVLMTEGTLIEFLTTVLNDVEPRLPEIPVQTATTYINAYHDAISLDDKDLDAMINRSDIFHNLDRFYQIYSPAHLSAAVFFWWTLCRTQRFGGHLFWVHKDAFLKFFNTRLTHLMTSDLKLPYPSMQLRIPDNFIYIQEKNHPERFVDTVYVSESLNNGHYGLTLLFMGMPLLSDDALTDDFFLRGSLKWKPSEELSMEVVVETAAKALWDWTQQNGIGFKVGDFAGEEGAVYAMTAIVNVLAYVAASGDIERAPFPADWKRLQEKLRTTPKGKRRKALVQQLKKVESVPRPYHIGKNYAKFLGEEERNRTPLTHAVSVRGHWRRQACGPKREKRVLTWVSPYVKGDKEAVKRHTFTIE